MAVLRPPPDDAAPKGSPESPVPSAHETTADMYASPDPARSGGPDRHVRLFGSHAFFRLWLVQVVSATGDWLAFSAIILLAAEVGGGAGAGAGAGAVSLVVAARIIPGFVFGPLAGVLVDRWDRRRTMVACDLGRAAVVATLPFVDSLVGLVLASLVLELLTLLWTPAKDATVPSLVPADRLTTANSLSLAAAYGTFPLAALLFALLAGVGSWLSNAGAWGFLRLDQMSLAFYVDVVTFLFAAFMVSRLSIPSRPRPVDAADREAVEVADREDRRVRIWQELRDGWRQVASNPTVRAVYVGLATGLVGGGMLIPLGAVFSTDILGAGAAGYGLFITALGFGVAVGVVLVGVLQRRIDNAYAFSASLLVAGAALFVGASTSSLGPAAASVFVMGVAVGPVYVLGFAMLQREVEDGMRGRVFGSLNTLVRLCVLLSMVGGPLLAAVLGRLAEDLLGGELDVGRVSIALPGVRLALWSGALVVLCAGVLSLRSVRSGERTRRARTGTHPSLPGSMPLPTPQDEASGGAR